MKRVPAAHCALPLLSHCGAVRGGARRPDGGAPLGVGRARMVRCRPMDGWEGRP